MTLNFTGLVSALTSHAQSLGVFESVNGHEPKSKPGHGLTAAVWVDHGKPAMSGLDATSAVVVLSVRLFSSMISEPQDMIDPELIDALDLLVAAYSGDFELNDDSLGVRCVDLLGMEGTSLSWQAGYVSQDNTMYRVMTISVPLIINDAWAQEA
jgi:hypothetical protein